MGKYIGIDLGTTFSCMAYINDSGQPEIIPNSEGENTTPSTVLFEGDSTIVGKEAKAQSLFEPKNFEQFVKRHMGERDHYRRWREVFSRSSVGHHFSENESRC